MQNGIVIIAELYDIPLTERVVGTFDKGTEWIHSAESYMTVFVELIPLRVQNEPNSSRINPIVVFNRKM